MALRKLDEPWRSTTALVIRSCSACLRVVKAASRKPMPNGIEEMIFARLRSSERTNERPPPSTSATTSPTMALPMVARRDVLSSTGQ